MSKVVIQL